MIYLDHNATTPPCAESVAAMAEALAVGWANPSSTHGPGQAARRRLADARARVAAFVGCQPAELVFTSGATEANHHAVVGALALGRAQGRGRWVLSALEHPGLQALADRLVDEGVAVDRLPARPDGGIDLDAARVLIRPDTALVSLMAANNETGVCQQVAEVGALARAAGARLHVDATQRAGRAPLDFAGSGADLMVLSAHKLHGPKGVGALAMRRGLALPPLLPGSQERRRRGGTENVPGIAGFAAACDRASATLAADAARLAGLRDRLQHGLAALPGTVVYGATRERLPNTLCLRFGTLDADAVLGRLERAGVVVSSGAACAAGGTEPSHVLLALGATPAEARAGVRFSLGRDTTDDDIGRTLAAVHAVVVPLLAEAAPAAAVPA